MLYKNEDIYKRILNRKLLSLVSEFKWVPYKLNKYSNYEVGKTYWCGYWEKSYKVLDVNGSKVRIEWEDGKVVEHMTSLNVMRDYELRPFEYKGEGFAAVIDPMFSYTAAEIKALIYNEVIPNKVANLIFNKYFDSKEAKVPNDYTYYYIYYFENINEIMQVNLKRDLCKSPYNFNNIKTIGDLYNDKRISRYVFFDIEGFIIDTSKNSNIDDIIPLFTPILKIEYSHKLIYFIKLDLYQRNDHTYARWKKGDIKNNKAYESMTADYSCHLLMIGEDGTKEYLSS